MSRKSKEHQFINDAATALAPFLVRISNMEPKELQSLVKACEGLTQTNCWWIEFRLAPLLKSEAKTELFDATNRTKKALVTSQ